MVAMHLYRHFCQWQSMRLCRRANQIADAVGKCQQLQVCGAPDVLGGEIDAAVREAADMRDRAAAWDRRSRD